MEIAIDFDGSCVTNEYPNIGSDIGAVPILREIVKRGHKLILFTIRSNKELEDAVQWFKTNLIPLHGINVNPGQSKWTSSPKVYAQLYIDDTALGAPLIYPENGKRPYLDWNKIAAMLLGIV